MKLWMRSIMKLWSVLVTLSSCDSMHRVSKKRKRGSIAAGLERNRRKVRVSKAGRYLLRISKSIIRSLGRWITASSLIAYISDPLHIPTSGIGSTIGWKLGSCRRSSISLPLGVGDAGEERGDGF